MDPLEKTTSYMNRSLNKSDIYNSEKIQRVTPETKKTKVVTISLLVRIKDRGRIPKFDCRFLSRLKETSTLLWLVSPSRTGAGYVSTDPQQLYSRSKELVSKTVWGVPWGREGTLTREPTTGKVQKRTVCERKPG